MEIIIQSDSEVWRKVKHALRASGQKYFLQGDLYDKNRSTLFLEEIPEPEGGELKRGLIVYRGGCVVGAAQDSSSDSELPSLEEILAPPKNILPPATDRPAAKSSTSVLAASVCQGCGCKLDGKAFKAGCTCRCHVSGPR